MMEKEKVIEMLYEYATGRLSDEDIQLVELELYKSSDLQEELKGLRETLGLLDDTNPPQPSMGFVSRLKRSIQERASQKNGDKRPTIFDIMFKPFHIKIPLEVLGIIVVFFAIIMIYRMYVPEIDYQGIKALDPIIGKALESVENPIIISTRDVKETYKSLTHLVQSHNGSIVRRITFDAGVTIYINVSEIEEESLINDLSSLGRVQSIKKGYKDREGNIVIALVELK